MVDNNTLEEQRKFLQKCEDEFKNRYTKDDPEFMKMKSTEPKKPPIVDPWYNKPRRPQSSYNWKRQNQNQGHRHHERNNKFHPYHRTHNSEFNQKNKHNGSGAKNP